MRIDLHELLKEHCNVKPKQIKEKILNVPDLAISQLRDRLYLLGNILHEDLQNQVYVASVSTDDSNMTSAVVAMQLIDGQLIMAGYAKEGLIKQNICDRAIQRLVGAIEGDAIPKKRRKGRMLPIVLLVISLSAFALIRFTIIGGTNINEMSGNLIDIVRSKIDPAFAAEIEQTMEATKEYNAAAEQYNLRVTEYNAAVSMCCIDNIYGLPAALELIALESESFDDNVAIIRSENDKDKILADAALIEELTGQVDTLIKVVKQVTAPSGDWIMERLNRIEGITGCDQVTEAQNPDGILGKDGGYVACVYFTHSTIDHASIPGDSIVAKGTDAGGAVEVYATVEDAQARVDYLAGFDETILYSGSYAIVGTTVVRTSYKLTAEQQLLLTHDITKVMTIVE